MITLHDAEWIRLSSFSGYSVWPKYFSRKIFINSSCLIIVLSVSLNSFLFHFITTAYFFQLLHIKSLVFIVFHSLILLYLSVNYILADTI